MHGKYLEHLSGEYVFKLKAVNLFESAFEQRSRDLKSNEPVVCIEIENPLGDLYDIEAKLCLSVRRWTLFIGDAGAIPRSQFRIVDCDRLISCDRMTVIVGSR